MKPLYATLLLIFFYLSTALIAYSQPPSIAWQKTFGGTSYDQVESVIQTNDGGFAAAGIATSTNGNVTGNHGFGDFWIIKLNDSGVLQWQKSYGGSNDEGAFSITETSDLGFAIAGSSTSSNGNLTLNHGLEDFWIIKLNASGILQWQKSLGGSSVDIACDIHQTSDLGFIIAGYSISSDGDLTSNHGSEDYWIVKLDASGNLQWQKTFGGSMDERAWSVQQTTDGGYIAAGYTRSTNGDVTGNHGDYDFWIIKLNSSGTLQWQKTLGGTLNDQAKTVQQTTDGGYIVSGFTASTNGDVTSNHGSEDLWIVKLNSSGVLQWEKSLGGSGVDQAYQLKQLSNGDYVFAGSSYSLNGEVTGNHGGYDFWVTRTDGSGNIIWQKSLGGSPVEEAYSISLTNDNGYIVAGGTLSNDGDVSGNYGDFDYWIVKLNENITLPIELITFQGFTSEDKIRLEWSTASEINNKGFQIERYTTSENNFDSIGWIDGHGNSISPNAYFYDDMEVKKGMEYYYRLKQIDYNNSISYSNAIVVKMEEENLSIYIAPNPFQASTQLHITLNDQSTVRVKVINGLGNTVFEVPARSYNPGNYSRNINPGTLSDGMYHAIAWVDNKKYFFKLMNKKLNNCCRLK